MTRRPSTRREPATQAQGFALAAAAHDDAGAERARDGITAELAQSIGAAATALAKADRPARRAFVRELLETSHAHALAEQQDGRHPRALALLATRAPRELGRAWLRAAPAPRAGYAPGARLVALLARLSAEPAGATEPAAAEPAAPKPAPPRESDRER